MTYPFEEKFYDSEDFSAPVLNKAFDGTQGDIVLPLPNDVKVSDLKWISIWSREYLLNFGDFIFKDDQKEEESEFEGGKKRNIPNAILSLTNFDFYRFERRYCFTKARK